jgi:hypothetical protein
MQCPSEDIKDMLENESSAGFLLGSNLFIGREPSSPKKSVTLFDSFGYPPQLNLVNQGYEYPAIQVRVRDTDYRSGWEKCEEIKNLLHGRNHETWNGALYTVISCASGPALLDWDDNNNVLFVINFNLQRRAV